MYLGVKICCNVTTLFISVRLSFIVQHNIITAVFLFVQDFIKNRWATNIITVFFLILGFILAIETFLAFDVAEDSLGPKSLRNLLLIDLVYVLIIAGLVAIRVVRLIGANRSRSAGSRLHARLTRVFIFVALMPTIIVAIFATVSINFGLEGWFSSTVQRVVGNSMEAAKAYESEHRRFLRKDLLQLSDALNSRKASDIFLGEANTRDFLSRQQPEGLSEAYLIDLKGTLRSRGYGSYLFDFEPVNENALVSAKSGDIVIIKDWPNNEFRALMQLKAYPNRLLYVTRDVEGNILQLLDETQDTVALYQRLEAERGNLLFKFALLYVAFSLVIILLATWLALWFAERLSKPVGLLAEAAQRVGSGDLDVRIVEQNTDDEIAILGKIFNRMTKRVKKQRDTLIAINMKTETQRHFFETVIGGVTGGIISLDPQGKIDVINPAALRMLDLELEYCFGQNIENAIPEFAYLYKKTKSLEMTSVVEELQFSRLNSREHILIKISVRKPENSNLEGFIITFDNITDLVSAQRNAAWGDVARRIAHEIKNPLTPIQLSAEQLKRKFSSMLTEEKKELEEYSDMIIRQTESLGRIVDEFSQFARLPIPIKSQCDLISLLKSAILLHESFSNVVTFETSFPTTPIFILIDSNLMTQALNNLLKNAIESINTFADDSDLKTPHFGKINVILKKKSMNVEILIIDNGIGLPKDQRNLYEPYVTSRKEGTGLGLAIVKKIIEEHDGVLELYNNDPSVNGLRRGVTAKIILSNIEPEKSETGIGGLFDSLAYSASQGNKSEANNSGYKKTHKGKS